MALEAIVDTLDNLDASLHEHYKKDDKSGKYLLDVGGFDALPRVKALKDEAAQHRIKARSAEQALEPFKALGDLAEVQAKLDSYDELKAAAEGKLDDAKINGIVEGRVKAKVAPLERELGQLRTQLGEKDKVIEGYTAKERSRMIGGALGKAARDLKVVDSALEDVELYGERLFEVQEDGTVVTRDGVGVTPGLSPKQWLEDMQGKRPHWWGPTAGGGAGGSRGANTGASNPWSAEGWNVTEQGNVIRTKGRAEADRLAKLAGTTVGGPQPKAKK